MAEYQDELGPIGSTPEIADPNFAVTHPGVGQAGKAGQAGFGEFRGGGPIGADRPPQVRDVMSPAVEVCTPQTELYYVARMMADRDVGAIPVVQNTDSMCAVGIITDRDIVVRAIARRQDVAALRARDCMSSRIVSTTAEEDLAAAVQKMEREQVRRLMVLDGAGRLIGILAQADIALRDEPVAGEMVQAISKPDGAAEQRRYH